MSEIKAFARAHLLTISLLMLGMLTTSAHGQRLREPLHAIPMNGVRAVESPKIGSLPPFRNIALDIVAVQRGTGAPDGIPDPIFRLVGFLGNKSTDTGRGITTDAEGNFYVVGSTDVGGVSYPFLAKYNNNQVPEFYTIFRPDDVSDPRYISAEANGVALDSEGNIVIVGTALDGRVGDTDVFVTKLAPDGATELFTRIVIGTSFNDVGNGIAVNSTNGNIYLTGTAGLSLTTTAMFAVSTNAQGDRRFAVTILPAGDIRSTGHGVAVDVNDYVYLAGSSTDILQTTFALALKLDQRPGIAYIWHVGVPGAQLTRYNGVTNNSRGDAYFAGEANGGGVWTKIASNGDIVWNYRNEEQIQFNSVALQDDGNAIALGGFFNRPPLFNNIDAFLMRTDANGVPRDSIIFDGSDEERAYAITTTADAIVMAGDTRSSDFAVTDGSSLRGVSDAFVAKISTNPAFVLAAEHYRLCLLRGLTIATRVFGAGVFGFDDYIVLSASGLPEGITAVFAPELVRFPEISTLTFTADLTAAPGTYTVFIHGRNEGIDLTRTRALELLVTDGFCL